MVCYPNIFISLVVRRVEPLVEKQQELATTLETVPLKSLFLPAAAFLAESLKAAQPQLRGENNL